MFSEWLRKHTSSLNEPRPAVIDLFGSNAMALDSLADQFPQLQFQSARTLQDVPQPPGPVLAYLVRNTCWNKTDSEVVESIEAIARLLEQTPRAARYARTGPGG